MKNIEEKLKEHLQNKALLEKYKLDIEALNEVLRLHDTISTEKDSEVIEGMQLSASTISDMPRNYGETSSKTERTAMQYLEECCYINECDTQEIKLQIHYIERKVFVLRQKVERVENAIKSLGDKEKYCITRRYLDSYSINEVIKQFAVNFGYGSYESIRNIINNAIRRIEKLI